MNKSGSCEIDIKSGRIMLKQMSNGKRAKHSMFMKIFRNEYEHHAQLYTDSDYKFMYGYISMRKCKIYNSFEKNEIIICSSEKKHSGGSNESKGLVFEVEKIEDVSSWMDALTPDVDMPTVSELSPLVERRST
jgi:hypothetical protein